MLIATLEDGLAVDLFPLWCRWLCQLKTVYAEPAAAAATANASLLSACVGGACGEGNAGSVPSNAPAASAPSASPTSLPSSTALPLNSGLWMTVVDTKTGKTRVLTEVDPLTGAVRPRRKVISTDPVRGYVVCCLIACAVTLGGAY